MQTIKHAFALVDIQLALSHGFNAFLKENMRSSQRSPYTNNGELKSPLDVLVLGLGPEDVIGQLVLKRLFPSPRLDLH